MPLAPVLAVQAQVDVGAAVVVVMAMAAIVELGVLAAETVVKAVLAPQAPRARAVAAVAEAHHIQPRRQELPAGLDMFN